MEEHRIIVLGSAGVQMGRAIISQEINPKNLFFLGSNIGQFNLIEIENKHLLLGIKPGLGNYEITEEIFNLNLSFFEEIFKPQVHYFLACGLGGLTASGLVAKLTKLLIQKNRKFTIIAITPFSWEGKRRKERASLAYDQLVSLAKEQLILVSLDQLSTQHESNILDTFNYANQCVAQIIKEIIVKGETSYRFDKQE